MSRTSSALLLVLLMFGCAIYFLIKPPFQALDDSWVNRIIIPFLFISCALTVLDNLRTRIHMGQLVGALRSISGRAGIPPAPRVTGEAIEILIKALRTGNESTRTTALKQIKQITGADAGTTADEWETWYRANKSKFRGGPQL